jgi:hypothetical protein
MVCLNDILKMNTTKEGKIIEYSRTGLRRKETIC